MGNFLDTPITEKETEVGEDAAKGLKYGISAMQGWRAQMEDDHVQLLSLPQVATTSAPARALTLPPCAGVWHDCLHFYGAPLAASPFSPPFQSLPPRDFYEYLPVHPRPDT